MSTVSEQASEIQVPADAVVEVDEHATTSFQEDDDPGALVGEQIEDDDVKGGS